MMVNDNFSAKGASICFRNFSGKESKFNPAGRRNFCVRLDPEIAESMARDGWNIRVLSPREEGQPGQPIMQVNVSYANFPPKIILISGRGKTILNEQTVSILDWADIKCVDLIVRPYNWEVGGKLGVKGYVKSMYVTIEEDEFESQYSDVPFGEG